MFPKFAFADKFSVSEDVRFAELSIDELICRADPRRLKNITPLAKSISQLGVLQPVTVRKCMDDHYEVICGKRRIHAARLAGLRSVPCYIAEPSDSGAAAAELTSLLHTEQPDPFFLAEKIGSFCTLYHFTEQQAAIILGMPRKAVSDKLKLLALTAEQRDIMSEHDLSEDHAQIILSLPVNERDIRLAQAAEYHLSPEKLREKIRADKEEEKKIRSYRRRSRALADTRLFFNTVEKAVRILRLAGVNITTEKNDRDGFTEYMIKVPVKS